MEDDTLCVPASTQLKNQIQDNLVLLGSFQRWHYCLKLFLGLYISPVHSTCALCPFLPFGSHKKCSRRAIWQDLNFIRVTLWHYSCNFRAETYILVARRVESCSSNPTQFQKLSFYLPPSINHERGINCKTEITRASVSSETGKRSQSSQKLHTEILLFGLHDLPTQLLIDLPYNSSSHCALCSIEQRHRRRNSIKISSTASRLTFFPSSER